MNRPILDCLACIVRLGCSWHGLCRSCYSSARKLSVREHLTIEEAVRRRIEALNPKPTSYEDATSPVPSPARSAVD